ncbi:hypothetical protein H257_06551, partial [Aphanomyces astaci]
MSINVVILVAATAMSAFYGRSRRHEQLQERVPEHYVRAGEERCDRVFMRGRPLLRVHCHEHSSSRVRRHMSQLVHVLALLNLPGQIARIVLEGLKSSEPASSFARCKAPSSPRQSETADCGGWKVLLVQSLIAGLRSSNLISWLWQCVMAYHLWLWVVWGFDCRRMCRHIRILQIVSVLVAVALSAGPFFGPCPAYDIATFAAAITSSPSLLVVCHVLWLVFSLGIMVVAVLVVLCRKLSCVSSRMHSSCTRQKPNHLAAYHQVGKVLTVCIWYSILYRIVEAPVLALNVIAPASVRSSHAIQGPRFALHHVLGPLEGCGLAVLYGGAVVSWSAKHDAYVQTTYPSSSSSNHHTSAGRRCHSLDHMCLFVTAY